jgi:hypothetical protein
MMGMVRNKDGDENCGIEKTRQLQAFEIAQVTLKANPLQHVVDRL